MERFLKILLVGLFCVKVTYAQPQLSAKVYKQAIRFFAEAQQASDKDQGKLWGKTLYGPMLFIKFPERLIIANQSDDKGWLKPQGKLYVGKLPKNLGVANTAQLWGGKKWTTVIWYRFDEQQRVNLFMHELYHRIQSFYGHQGKMNQHLDEKEARILICLEWNALLRAYLNSKIPKGKEKRAIKKAIEAALVFRAYRHQLYQGSEFNEKALEMNEGLAEYTGVKLGGMSAKEVQQTLQRKVASSQKRKTLVRSFAYISGPLYGLLLDQYAPFWRQKLSSGKGFGQLLKEALQIQLPKQAKVMKKMRLEYGAKAIRIFEEKRAKKIAETLQKHRKTLVEGPVLQVTLSKTFRYTFDPNQLISFKKRGTIYPQITVRDNWGILQVKNGGSLMSTDKTNLRVPLSKNFTETTRQIKTSDWHLELKEGWHLAKDKQTGNWRIEQE